MRHLTRWTACMTLTLTLTACPRTSAPTGGNVAALGLGAGVTNAMTCTQRDGRLYQGSATAVALALRDRTGQPIAGTTAADLTLTVPDGRSYRFVSPYDPAMGPDVLPAAENVYVLCQAAQTGEYTITGTIDHQPVQDAYTLTDLTAPTAVSAPTTLSAQGVHTAQVSVALPDDTRVALVNYYRGARTAAGAYAGYRVGTGLIASATTAPQPLPLPSPAEDLSAAQATRAQEGSTLEGDIITQAPSAAPDLPIDIGELSTRPGRAAAPVMYVPVTFTPAGAATGTIAGRQSIPITLPAGHVAGEPYYAEVISSSLTLGRSTSVQDVQRVNLTVQYSPVLPESTAGIDWTPRLSPSRMNAWNVLTDAPPASAMYTTLTTSMLTPDGFPTARTWTVDVQGPGGTWTFTYPAFTAFVLASRPAATVPAGAYTATFRAPDVVTSTPQATLTITDNDVLGPTPEDVNLTLNSDLQGFTFTAGSGLRSHWVYVTQDGVGPTVASGACLQAQPCALRARAPLSRDARYRVVALSTDAPLDRAPLETSSWDFTRPVRWTLTRRAAATNPSVPAPGTRYDVLDVQGRAAIEATGQMTFGLFDAGQPVPLQGVPVTWSLASVTRPGSVTLDPATGTVTGTGSDLGEFTVKGVWNSTENYSKEIAVFGLACAGGGSSASGSLSFLCKFRDANLQSVNTEFTVVNHNDPMWNHGQPFVFTQDSAFKNATTLGEYLDAAFVTPGEYDITARPAGASPGALALPPVYTDRVTIGGVGLSLPKAEAVTLAFNGPTDTFRLSWAPVPDARAYKVRVQSGVPPVATFNTYVVPASDAPTLDLGYVYAPQIRITALNVPLSTQVDEALPSTNFLYSDTLCSADPDLTVTCD
ncbi:hypothetical protein [Deinococcus radiotolerans]|uniref:Ig-like domain-containing protein n=1 Tax=Deinococcus radiotolerans TaxID=1309407 RepID=A0ABQ2FNI2_9DEIO|nr:hypothetical protein [Deinococcus radiotolerans]GGL11429.1 hypothetical protein GCM10010844_32660 [Deinococcus radiotolerans]